MGQPVRSRELSQLLIILADKYLYGPLLDNGGLRLLTIGPGARQSANAVCLQVLDIAPFLLAVACPKPPTKAMREAVIEYLHGHDTIGLVAYYVASDDRIEAYRRRYSDGELEHVRELEYHFRPTSQGGLGIGESRCDDLLPITHELENLLFEVHSVMRDIDGLHADSALEELCKLIYVKSYLEEQRVRIPLPSLRSSTFGTVESCAACLRALYREAGQYDVRVFRLKIPGYERSRGVFNDPFRLSSAALVKSYQLVERYTLLGSPTDVKGRAFQRVLTKSVRSGMGQYFTPSPVCSLMVAIVDPSSTDLIIDPFCGSGHFLSRSLEVVRAKVDATTKEYHEFAFGKLHGIEKSDRMTRIAMTDMRLNGDGHSNIRCTDALLDLRNYPDLAPESFDIVLTNPPFGSLLGEEAFQGLAGFELARGRKRVPLEVVGLERAVQFLRPGGRLAIVLPESVFSASSMAYVREWLQARVCLRAIIDLPSDTFSAYGANVQSGVLIARKWRDGEVRDASQQVCVVRLDNLGYDAAGRPRSGSEEIEAANYVRTFIRKRGW